MKLLTLTAAVAMALCPLAASAQEEGGPDLTRLPLGDLAAAASKLGVSQAVLKAALGVA